jgi:hypothetical protein
MKRAQRPEDIIERPALVYDTKTGEIFELDKHPELLGRLKEKAAKVWYRQAELAVKDELHIEGDLIKWN